MSGWVLIAAVHILSPAKGQDQVEHEGQQQQTDGKAHALVEGLGQVHHHLDGEIDVVEGDQQQQELPAVAVQHLAQNIGAVDGDDALPALAAHLLEDHPGTHHGQNRSDNFQKHNLFSFFSYSLCNNIHSLQAQYNRNSPKSKKIRFIEQQNFAVRSRQCFILLFPQKNRLISRQLLQILQKRGAFVETGVAGKGT